jgi:hypothetical protein
MRSVTVKDRQTWFDIGILSNGAAEAALVLADAAGSGITDVLTSGQKVDVFETDFFDTDIVQDLKAKNAIPATGDSDNYLEHNVFEGIGYWYIGLDFKVS